MSTKAFDKVRAGLEDALVYARGDTSRGTTHSVEVAMSDVKAIRKRLGMSQDAFARAIKVSPVTLRNWEQRRRRPEGPALALLEVVEREPEAALRALRQNR
jgi:putative transcriptional regulator